MIQQSHYWANIQKKKKKKTFKVLAFLFSFCGCRGGALGFTYARQALYSELNLQASHSFYQLAYLRLPFYAIEYPNQPSSVTVTQYPLTMLLSISRSCLFPASGNWYSPLNFFAIDLFDSVYARDRAVLSFLWLAYFISCSPVPSMSLPMTRCSSF